MGRLCTPPQSFDPLTTVIGGWDTPYPCPDTATLDEHMARLCHRIEHATPQFPGLVAGFWADIDLLLDRREWLEIEQEPAVRDAA